MTADPPETGPRKLLVDPQAIAAEYDPKAEAEARRGLVQPTRTRKLPERDPSNLNDPRLQRWVIAFAWLLVLVILGTCVAGGLCLTGAFQRCDCEESDG